MNTNVAEEHSKTLQTKEKSGKRPDNSTNIFERNILDLYIDQPNHTICGGKYCMQDSFCFPKFAFCYRLIYKPKEADENYKY